MYTSLAKEYYSLNRMFTIKYNKQILFNKYMTVKLLAIKEHSHIEFTKIQLISIYVCIEIQITCLQKNINNKNVI